MARRLSADDGVSLAEMLVALFIVTVALLALVGGLISSAKAVADQRQRSAATRVATAHHEHLRGLEFEAVTSGTSTVAADGRTYTLDTTVTQSPAAPDGVTVPTGAPDVKHVETTVSWMSGTVARSAVYATSISPPDPDPVDVHEIVSISMAPNPTVIGVDGKPTKPVLATVVLDGFDSSAVVGISWTNAGGTTKTRNLTSHDGGVTWTGELANDVGAEIIVPTGAGSVTFSVSVGALERDHTLSLTAPGPEVTAIELNPDPITVRDMEGSCNEGEYCNVETVSVAATVSGVDSLVDSVRLTYTLADGTPRETALVFDTVEGHWAATFPAGSTQFKTGEQRFTVVALTAAGGGSGSGYVDRQVLVVS